MAIHRIFSSPTNIFFHPLSFPHVRKTMRKAAHLPTFLPPPPMYIFHLLSSHSSPEQWGKAVAVDHFIWQRELIPRFANHCFAPSVKALSVWATRGIGHTQPQSGSVGLNECLTSEIRLLIPGCTLLRVILPFPFGLIGRGDLGDSMCILLD